MNKLFYFLFFICFTSCGVQKSLKDRPDLSTYHSQEYTRNQVNDSLFYIADNFLKKNKTQNWELYVSGDALEIGDISSLTFIHQDTNKKFKFNVDAYG